jgi:23S rRNA pseudouridine2605 synthase
LRINQFLARAGLGSRRGVEQLIHQRRVKLNGSNVTNLSTQVDPVNDIVTVDKKKITLPQKYSVIALNKPVGYICSKHDPKHEKTVYNLLPAKYQHFKYGGRLDIKSRGLVIFSNDGDFIYQITHPGSQIPKFYLVKFKGKIENWDEFKKKLKVGIWNEGEILKVDSIKLVKAGLFSIILTEGRKNHIRRIMQTLRITVKDLYRYGVGNLFQNKLHLAEGKWKEVSRKDIFKKNKKNLRS